MVVKSMLNVKTANANFRCLLKIYIFMVARVWLKYHMLSLLTYMYTNGVRMLQVYKLQYKQTINK